MIEAKYQAAQGSTPDGYYKVKLDGKWGMIDQTGKTVVPFEFYGFTSTNNEEFTIAARETQKWGLIDKEGKEATELKYSSIYTCPYGEVFLVKTGGKWGLMDMKGKELTEMKYDDKPMQVSTKPAVFKANADGNQFSISETGVETIIGEAKPTSVSLNSNANSSSSKTTNDKKETPAKSQTFKCNKCGNVTQVASGTPSGGTCPAHVRGSGSSTSHTWKRQ